MLVLLLAAACAISVANIYYNQPLLSQIAIDLHQPAGYLPAFSQIGTGLGMFLFVPLGDLFERRGLIVAMCLATASAAAFTAISPTLGVLSFASLLLGLTSIVPHLILPYAAQVSAPEQRGRVLGTVLSGLLTGILLARTASGFLGSAAGWRAVYWMAAALMILLAVLLRLALPESRPLQKIAYPDLISSIFRLARQQALLREASLIGAMLFGAFSAFWATLIYVLSAPPYHYGARMAGTFGLIGMAGALAASAAGRVADRKGPRYTVGLGIGIAVGAWVLLAIAGKHLWGLIAGVTLLDLGVQTGHVSNQSRIYGLFPEARSRLNTVYMVCYFAGGAAGSALAALGWRSFGWNGVCGAGFLMAVGAGVIHRGGGSRS